MTWTGVVSAAGTSALLVIMGVAWWRQKNRVATFIRYQAGATTRCWDALWWTAFHLWAACNANSRLERRLRAFRAVTCLGMFAALGGMPLLGVLLAGAPSLREHGLAAGLGGLVWALLIEAPDQYRRNAEYQQASPNDVTVAEQRTIMGTALLVLLDGCVYLLFRLRLNGELFGFFFGASLVAITDLTACLLTLAIGAAQGKPFVR